MRCFAERRLPLIQAFRQQLDGWPLSGPGFVAGGGDEIPAELYELDGAGLSARQGDGAWFVRSLDAQQR